MIAVDTNILVYAHRRESPSFAAASAALSELAAGSAVWAIPTPCLAEFCAVVTNPRAFRTPTTFLQLQSQIEAWSQSPSFAWLHSTLRHWSQLRSLAESGTVVGGQFHDARIAAVCLENGVRELWSADRDFGRFPALRVRNPLVAGGGARVAKRG